MSHGDAPGTITGYGRHRRAGEAPCDACADAHRAYNRAWDAANKPSRRFDPIAVGAAVAGHRVTLTRAELGEAIRELNARHLTDPQIATRLRVSARTVLRRRRQLGIPPAVPPGHRTAA